ncbi:Uncharacterized conserved protein YgbK, DUF1537 family [Catalinimonas alkaloidigena]|uniref:Uncharacterized conserved protein YgbK, DUF1537 family n=1 Tax=Catalinimonas alkaloidigena TaxID=1075417 RepID=A0A1G9R8I1_9BACT|nr:four-carbon acid sugar kinase family protein [Catalinimonas alkaloidigena]SDM19137.1 Uncharacterized conserved protein YgbK, DUF1537 family [Catalinimonas alkaloidigena]
MIAVIADDFTGAAELGGLGLRHGLRVEVSTEVPTATEAELLVVATDTRSTHQAAAVQRMRDVTAALQALQPHWMYKKVDSVLRGHVLAELAAHLDVLGLQRALLVPANPHLGRTIRDGHYFLHGTPLHQTSFAHDPEFAITSSRVLDRIGTHETHPVQVGRPTEPLPASSITLGEAEHLQDLTTWAQRADPHTLTAGASGFFAALLKHRSPSVSLSLPEPPPFQRPALYVCGSTFHQSRERVRQERAHGGPVSYMPAAVVRQEADAPEALQSWADEIVRLLRTHDYALVAIDPQTTEGVTVKAADLRDRMARSLAHVVQQVPVPELFLEGGSTASALLQRLGLRRFHPVHELAPGVIRMRADGPLARYLTLKPGSYAWPDAVWHVPKPIH